jgi:hypothetical protein
MPRPLAVHTRWCTALSVVLLHGALPSTTRAQSPAPPRAGLNHFYVIPDSVTFRAMEASRFLRDTFGIFESRTTRRSDQTYTGIYWYGRHTYFEFLPPGPGGRRTGDSGVAFGTDDAGDSTWVRAQLASFPGDSVVSMAITRGGLHGEQVPWFRQIARAGAANDPTLVTWTMTYAPTFLTQWRADGPLTSASSRAAVLERYAQVVNGYARRDSVPFADVRGLIIAVAPVIRARVLSECRALGWRVFGSRCVSFDGTSLTFVPATEARRGVQRIELRLRRPWPGPAMRQIGNSTLRITGATTAIWDIVPR